MSIYVLPPGGWHAGSGLAAELNPPDWTTASNPPDWNAASNPPDWTTANNPPDWTAANHPPDTAAANPPDWTAHAAARAIPGPRRPWLGTASPWTQGSPAALMAVALRQSRQRVVKPQDPRLLPVPNDRVRAVDSLAPLWRWQPLYRVQAVQAELLARLAVQDQVLWYMPPPSRQLRRRQAQRPQELFALSPLPAQPEADDFDAVAQFRAEQIDKVIRAAVEREDRLPEILAQADDIGSFFDAITGVPRQQAPHLTEVLQAAWTVTTHVVMALKNQIAEWRPVQRSSQVFPMIATPGHGSLPSGHATMSALTARLLSTLLYQPGDDRIEQLDRLARRIAFNRVVAGVHFQMDSAAGYALGHQLADTLVALATTQPLPEPVSHVVREHPTLGEEAELTPPRAPDDAAAPHNRTDDGAPQFALLWQAARNERRLLRA